MHVPPSVRRLTAAVAIGLLAGVVSFAAPPAASAAAPPGIHTVRGQSVYDSQGVKQASLVCPAGEELISIGASVSNRAGVRVGAAWMVTPSSAAATGREDAVGTAQNWLVEVTGKCAPLATIAALDVETVYGISPASSADKSIVATCPPGKWIAGVGGWATGADAGRVVVDQLVPVPGLRTALGHGSEDETNPTGAWTLVLQATCIDTEPHLSILQAVNAERVFPQCPPSYPYAIGGGAAMATDVNPPNQVFVPGGLGEKVITMFGAGGDLDSYQSAARMRSDATGFPAWARVELWGYAVCL